jgi:hypothetical protein
MVLVKIAVRWYNSDDFKILEVTNGFLEDGSVD